MDSTKVKSALHFAVSVGGNILMIGVVPPQYKALSILVFNIVQVLYAYYDTSYAVQKFGKMK